MAVTFAVLGSGGWGTAAALVLAQKPDHAVRLWSAHAESAMQLLATRENARLLPGIRIPDAIHITSDEAEAIRGLLDHRDPDRIPPRHAGTILHPCSHSRAPFPSSA